MTWFCHGLEDRLRVASVSRDSAIGALQEVAKWRGVLGGLVDDPESALRTLRATYGKRRVSSMPVQAMSVRPHEDEARSPGEEATVRVAAASVEPAHRPLRGVRGRSRARRGAERARAGRSRDAGSSGASWPKRSA